MASYPCPNPPPRTGLGVSQCMVPGSLINAALCATSRGNFNFLKEQKGDGWAGWQARRPAGGRFGAAGADDAAVMHGQIKLPHVTLCDLQPFRYSGTLTQLPPQHTLAVPASTQHRLTDCSPRNFKGAWNPRLLTSRLRVRDVNKYYFRAQQPHLCIITVSVHI